MSKEIAQTRLIIYKCVCATNDTLIGFITFTITLKYLKKYLKNPLGPVSFFVVVEFSILGLAYDILSFVEIYRPI